MRIVAWLANQMFQYAVWRALSLERGDGLYLDIDPFYYDIREYELHFFAINEHIATAAQKPWYLHLRKNKLLDSCRYPLILSGKKFNPHHLIENSKYPLIHPGMFDYNPAISEKVLAHPTQDFYLEWFWQSEKYFTKHQDLIRKDFTLKTPISDPQSLAFIQKAQHPHAVSLHVRRADYIGTHYEHICGLDYYTKAITYMKNKLINPIFYVFSDDIAWCKEQFHQYGIHEYVDRNTGINSYKDMILMSSCNHHIIANSTFSRWWAWLDTNPDKLVIAPKQRHAHADYADIIPDKWIRL